MAPTAEPNCSSKILGWSAALCESFCQRSCFRLSGSGLRVKVLRFPVWGLGFGVWGLGFGVWGSSLGFSSFGFRFRVFGFWIWGFGFGVSGFVRFWVVGFRIWSFGFGVSGFGFGFFWFGISGLGFGIRVCTNNLLLGAGRNGWTPLSACCHQRESLLLTTYWSESTEPSRWF